MTHINMPNLVKISTNKTNFFASLIQQNKFISQNQKKHQIKLNHQYNNKKSQIKYAKFKRFDHLKQKQKRTDHRNSSKIQVHPFKSQKLQKSEIHKKSQFNCIQIISNSINKSKFNHESQKHKIQNSYSNVVTSSPEILVVKQRFNTISNIQTNTNFIRQNRLVTTNGRIINKSDMQTLQKKLTLNLNQNKKILKKSLSLFKNIQGMNEQKIKKFPNINTISMIDQKQRQQTQKKYHRPLIPYSKRQLEKIKSQSYIILQYPSNQIILHYNSNIKLQIASLTKIMTFYVVIKLASLHKINIKSQIIQIQQYVQQITGTTAQIEVGELYTIQNLLYGLMLPSGNDAAVCLADWGGSLLSKKNNKIQNIKFFVNQMNKSSSKFQNPHGLPHPNSRSSAFDISLLISICMKYNIFCEVINTKKYQLLVKSIDNSERTIKWQNTNKLLRRQGFQGVKTGITITAGPCLASCYRFNNKRYIVVLLRTNKISRRFKQTRKLLYYCLKKMIGQNKEEISEQQLYKLECMNRNNKLLDSDYSEDEQQFIFGKQTQREFQKRSKILKYQL